MKWFLLCASFVAATSVASASLVYNLTDDSQCTGGCGTSPFGTVTLSQTDSNGVANADDVTVTVQLNAGYLIQTGGPHVTFGYNITTATTPPVSGPPINVTFTPSETGHFAVAAPGFGDAGYGTFDYGINGPSPSCTGMPTTCFSTLVFTVSLTAGGALPITDFVENAAGFIFEADIYSTKTGNTGEVAAVCTSGPNCGGTVLSNSPEPLSFVLMGSGLALVGLMRRRRR